MSDTSDGQMDSNQIELSPSAPHTNIPYLLPSNNNILPFSSDPSNQDLFLTAPPSSDATPLIISAINCRDEDSTSQFPDVDLLCLQSPIKCDTLRTPAAPPSMELLLQFDDLLAPPPIQPPAPIQVPLSGQSGSSLPSAPEQSDSGGSGDQFDTPPSTPSWNTDVILDTSAPQKAPLAPATETSVPSTPVPSDDVMLTPPKGGVNSATTQPQPQTESPRGSMLVIHGMEECVSIERLRLHFWLYRASILCIELHTDPADPGLRLGVVKFCSSQLADQLTREFSQLPICGQTHRTTATACDLPVSDRGRDPGEYMDSPCSVMEGAPVPRERRARPPSPASRAFSPDTGTRLDPNRVPRDSGKFQRMDPAEGQPKIHSIIITNISNIDHPVAANVIRTYVMNWWEIQIQSIICTDDQVRPNCAIMYINTFHKNLPELILEKLKTNKFVFPPLEATIRWNSCWTGHRNQQHKNKRTHDTSPSQESFDPHESFQQDMESDNYSHPSAPPLSPPERAPLPCTPPQEETALLLHKVMSPVNQESLSSYFREFLVYTVSWEAVSLEGESKCVRVVFSNGEVAAEAKQSLEHTPFNGAYVVFSIGTDADIQQQQQQQQQQCLSSPQLRSTPDDAYLMITGFDDFITPEYFEAHSIVTRYTEHYSEIRVQTNKNSKMKRIRVKFHNRDEIIEAEGAFLRVEFRGKLLTPWIEHIGQTESSVSPVKPTLSPVKPTVPIIVVSSIPPGVTSSDIAFLFKPFGLVKKEIDIKPMGHNSALGQCKVVFESAESAGTAVQVKHGITYRGHILDVKLLSDLIQPATDPPAPLPTAEPEERRPETHTPPTQMDAYIEGDMSRELFSYFSDKFKTEIERFSQLGQLNHSGNTLALKHTDGAALHQFIDNYINEISESEVELSEEDLKLLHCPEQQNTPGTNIDKLMGAFKETGHIDYIVGHFPSSLHVFGHKRTVEVVSKNIKIFICSQIEIQCPLNLFFNKFPECLYPDSSKFEFKEIKLRINSASLDECKRIRKHIEGVISTCSSCEIKMTQKFLKPAHIFITRNGLQVSLLLRTPEGKYLDQSTKSIEGAVVCLCGVSEHVSSLIEVLENPCEESMTVSQNALQKLTKKRDKGSILLERFEAKSKVCIRLEKKNNVVVISGFIKEDVKAMVEELGKKLEDVRVTIPDSCLKKIQKHYLIIGQTKDPNVVAEIIQDLEVQFQLKVEFQNQNIQLSGDQDAILSFETNSRELEQFFSCRIPQRTFHKVVLEANGQQFAQLIFAYLGYLSEQDTFFIFEVFAPQPMANRVGSSDIQILATAHPPAMGAIEEKIKVIRPRSDTIKSTKEDFHLFISAADKFEVIKKNEFVEIIPNPKSHSLEFLSIGVCVKSAQELFASGISDQEDRRNVTITAHLALYIRRKGIINQLTAKFDCNLRLDDKGNSLTCLVQMDGKRDAIEKVGDHINALKNSINCKPFQIKYPSKKFFNQFQTEVIAVIDVIQEKYRVIIDARKLSVRGDSDKDCEVIIISECTADVDQAISQLKDFLVFDKSTHPLTPIQHCKLVDDMLPILAKQSCAGHYYLDLTRENLVIMALRYFAKEAIPNGDFNLESYIKYSCAEYRVPNLPIFHTLRIPQSVQKIDAIGKNNSVKIHPPQTMTESYKFEGNRDNVSVAFSEMEKYVQELSQFFGTCNIPVSCPIDALTADSDIGGFLESLSLPDPAILVTLPQAPGDARPLAQQLIASYEIPLHTHNLVLEIRSGDITKLKVDSIVNAANERLSHGAGVASAISAAGGPTVQQSSDQFIQQNGPLPVSGNVVLPPGNIQCKSIIHAVGPVWDEMKADQVKNELGSCIFNICATANSACYSSIALPAISAGIYGFPLDESTSIIIEAIQRFFVSQQFYSINKLILIDIKDNILQQFKTICDNCFNQTTPIPPPQPKLIPVKPPPLKAKPPKSKLPKVTPPTPPTPPQLTFQWCENDGTWKPYSDSSMQKLRLAYASDPAGTASISRSQYTYTVDFTSMLQSNDQTSVQRNVRVVNSSAPAEDADDVISPDTVPLTQPPSSWKDIRTETVVLYGRKDRLNEARETFEDLVKQLMKKTEFDVTHVSRSDLIPIMSACKCPFVKLALDEPTAGALKVIVEGYYKEVKTTETEIQANLMRLMQEQTPNLEGPPSNWGQIGTDEVCQLVLVQPPNPEYSEIVNKFRSTLPNKTILRVDRIQNSWLWTRYQQDKHRLVQKSSTGANEVVVYHGTGGNPPVHIYRGEQGFEARLASSGMWGTASYFAVDASYSDAYAYKTPEGNKQMFSVKICAGDVIEMQPDTTLRLPPLKSAATPQPQPVYLAHPQASSLTMQQMPFPYPPMSVAPPTSLPVPGATSQTAPQFVNDRYDTVCGQTGGSKVYMIYENGRAYPEYLITYR